MAWLPDQDMARGALGTVREGMKRAQGELAAKEFRGIVERHRRAQIELRTTEMAAADVGEYHKVWRALNSHAASPDLAGCRVASALTSLLHRWVWGQRFDRLWGRTSMLKGLEAAGLSVACGLDAAPGAGEGAAAVPQHQDGGHQQDHQGALAEDLPQPGAHPAFGSLPIHSTVPACSGLTRSAQILQPGKRVQRS